MIKATIKNLDSGDINKLFLSKYQPILMLKMEWAEETKCNYIEYRFADACGNVLPEDGFLECILLPRTNRVKINVEKFVPLKIVIEGYPQFLGNIHVGLSITTDTLKESICENFILPKREMILRTKERYLVTNMTLKDQGIKEEMEIMSDFIYVIHIDSINNPGKQSTVFCYATESTWKILDSKQAINYQRLHYDDEFIPIRQSICDTLRSFGGLYQEEFSLLLECKITVYITHPKRSRKTKQYTVTRIVWPLDPIAVVASETDTGPVVALWENQLYSLSTTFLKANITENALLAVGVILTLTIIDKRGASHTMYSPHTATILELMMKIDEFIKSDSYHLKKDGKWLVPEDTLQESKIHSGSTLIMDAKECKTLLVCDSHEYRFDSIKEDVTFSEFLSVANNLLDVKLNEKAIFECRCGTVLKQISEKMSHNSSFRHAYECMKNSTRTFTAHRQVRIHIEFDNGETIEIIESLRTKVFKIVNALLPEDDVGLHLVEGDKVYEKNKRLSDYISPQKEEVDLKLTRTAGRFSVVCRDRKMSYLENIAKHFSDSGRTHSPSLVSISSIDRRDFIDASSVEQPIKTLETSSSMNDLRNSIAPHHRLRASMDGNDPFVLSQFTEKMNLLDLENTQVPEDCERRKSAFRKIEMNEDEFFNTVDRRDAFLLHILLENGINVNSTQADGSSALYIAAQNNAVEIIELLLHFKANINIQRPNGATPLFIAVYEKNLEAVKILLENGANTECEVSGGITPIILAANNGDNKIVEQLCYYGAEVDKSISTGSTALFKAVQMNNYEAAKVLLLNGANVNVVLETGTTPLMRAVNDSFHSLARLLLEFGANINHSRNDGTTCLHITAQINDEKMTSLLINWGANMNASLADGGTPLHIAVYHNSFEVIDALLSSGANLNQPWLDGATPLHIAAILGSEKSARRLLEFGADPNSKMDDGATPIFIATQENRLDLINLFIEFSADLNCERNDGVTPIEMAYKLQLVDAATALKDGGAKSNISCRTQ